MAKQDSVSAPPSGGDRRRYPGVRSFEEQDWPRFFGRSRATDELLLRVLSVRLLLQFAPSGAGKTSLLNAGLFPKLRPHTYFPFIIRLNQTNESLAQAVRRSLKDAATKRGLKEPVIPDDTEDLWALLAGVQLWSHDLLFLTPVLVFDQFEEVFTLRDETFRKGFALEVGELSGGVARQSSNGHPPETSASGSSAPRVKIIISLGEEYLGQLEEFSASIPDLFHERLRLAPLTADEAKEAIVEPARLPGDSWLSPAFEFEPTCLETLIGFIGGVSDRFKVIEPLTLQLVCQQAETIAIARKRSDDRRPVLGIGDFGGLAGLGRLVQNHFNEELNKLYGSATQRHAREMFEQGLLDPAGKRLMLEQGEIERNYGLSETTLNALVESRLLRREPRNESLFYEISHDRLTETIAKNRRLRLPRWVKPTIAAGAVFILVLAVLLYFIYLNERAAQEARARAESALGLLLGEDLVSRLREAGLLDALKQVLDNSDRKHLIHESSKGLPLALKLRHQGDILREQGTIGEARRKFTESQAALDAAMARAGGSDPELMAEQARTLKRLGSLMIDAGEVTKAEAIYAESVRLWDQVLKGQPSPQEMLDAADTRIEFGQLRERIADWEHAESEYAEALHIALNVWSAAYDRIQGGRQDVRFELGRAMQIYADAALGLAKLSGGAPEGKGALALARESLRLRPMSFQARSQVGVASAHYGGVAAGISREELFTESRQQFEELTQFDPNSRRLQRERAALQLVISEGVATCAVTPACKKTLHRGELEGARIGALESTGNLRWLAGMDRENRSLQMDVAWGLQTQAKLLGASGSPALVLPLLDEAVAIVRKSRVDARDISNSLTVSELFLEKAGQLEQSAKALAALDEAIAELDRLPDSLWAVRVARVNTVDARINILKKLGRTDEAKRLSEDQEELRTLIGGPWDARKERASKLNSEGVQLNDEGTRLYRGRAGAAAMAKVRRALEEYQLAIREYPFEYIYWNNLGIAHQWIATIAKDLDDGAAAKGAETPESAKPVVAWKSHLDERQAALGGALAAAWMVRVLGPTERSALSWKNLYEARRSLAQFLRDEGRPEEGLPLVGQNVLDAKEYVRQKPSRPDALFLLADANVGLGMLRSECAKDGWEEALREALAYGDQLAKLEPMKAEHQKWIGDFRLDLGTRLGKAHQEAAAGEEYKLALLACREALRLTKGAPELRLAKGAPELRETAQSCLSELTSLGYE